ncbi:pyridoxamine 5'-phosphate oxidase-domain-containing protein [Exophiala viscosa]|uniref:Pyridoxamine 5'-phosphate oxidase-domain-containing protein n=1 Tax=Exophiala viscosa TaxID=2486360 RepID=A0AAN6IJF9_9EURO|nr:pyridoxamine 5'-phosphate oxidase-domain-containing protein [Exophiala viscosa]KAI1626607.1 pyridoxamine 5'-phosphate oxidase-domain-containing protein [Exophiala viscosa]
MYISSSLFTATLLLASRVSCIPVDHSHEQLALDQEIVPIETETSEAPLVIDDDDFSSFTIPSRYESTVLGRRLLALSKTGVLTTVFPESINSTRVPEDVARTPIGLPDYIASCEEPTGNPTLLALTVSTSTKNALAGSNVSLALSWWDEYVHITHKQPWSAANLPRLSMTGYLEEMTDEEVSSGGIAACFTKAHVDSVMWLPGKKWAAHKGVWMRMVVREVYWIGGFGDRAYIGWFDPEEWHGVKVDEWSEVRLPGEN